MRLVLALFTLLASTNAMAADWRLVGGGGDGHKVFVDAESIRVTGSMRRAWTIWNLGTPDEDGTQSIRGLNEFDCREGRRWTMQLSRFSLPDAGGKVISTYTYTNFAWSYVEPGAVDEALLKFVCARK